MSSLRSHRNGSLSNHYDKYVLHTCVSDRVYSRGTSNTGAHRGTNTLCWSSNRTRSLSICLGQKFKPSSLMIWSYLLIIVNSGYMDQWLHQICQYVLDRSSNWARSFTHVRFERMSKIYWCVSVCQYVLDRSSNRAKLDSWWAIRTIRPVLYVFEKYL